MKSTAATDVSDRRYDVVIVGAGVAGSIVAKVLAGHGRSVLVLEAGTDQALTYPGYLKNLDIYYRSSTKATNGPYPNNPNAPQPDVLDLISNNPVADSQGYLVQTGPLPFSSDYTRAAGGTTLHWLGTTLRMLPEDFKTRTLFGVGLDWPVSYADLKPHYARAEKEIGVSADIEDQLELARLLQLDADWLDPNYVFPMHRVPQSYSDKLMRDEVADLSIDYDGETYPIRLTSTPVGRNSTPNAAYPGGYSPVGAVGNPTLGQRCQGNSACVPICPVQAKYNALKTLNVAVATGRVDVITQAVASEVRLGPDGRVAEIAYKAYASLESGAYDTYVARGEVFVLAGNPVENVKLLLASGIGGDKVGLYLMDHPVLLTWGLADRPIGTFRGPGSTSGIETLRAGAFRRQRSAFRIEIDNWGWNWATGAPWSTALDMVSGQGLFGAPLRAAMREQVQRQVRLGFLLEVPPDPKNRISIDPAYKDRIDNYRPVLSFDLDDYVRAALPVARRTSDLIFETCGIEDKTVYNPTGPGYLVYEGRGYAYEGAGHYVGGHVMGRRREDSVVNTDQRLWDHDNLWLVGCGNMPTEGTSNPTLTMAALTFMAADRIEAALSK